MQKIVILKEVFGYDTFRVGQAEIIECVNNYQNVLAMMPTGGGKSLCYQLPALLMEGTTLVVSPLIALMRDQVRSLTQAGVSAAALHSQNTEEETKKIFDRARSGELKLLYVAPERLGSRSFVQLISTMKVQLLAVDEAHCVSQWGHDFRPDYLKIGLLRKILGEIPIAAFTATADPKTQDDIIKCLFTNKPKIFVNGFDRPNIRLSCKLKNQPRQQVLDFIRNHKDQSGIIYCGSRAKTEVLAKVLCDNGYRSEFYHAGMTAVKRQEVEAQFQTEDDLIVCATIAFGMGIDKPDIRYVIHADLPKSIENYYQEIGRSGRDGLPADSLLLYGLDDVRFRRMQIDDSLGDLNKKNADHGRLNALLEFVEAQACRRSKILEYFEKKTFGSCNNCDICSEAPKLFDATEYVRKALSVILRTKENFGTAHLIDILRGLSSEKIRSLSHDQLPTFGLGRELNQKQWQAIFLQIVGLDYIRPAPDRYGAYYLTKKSLPILKGNEKVTLKVFDVSKKIAVKQLSEPRTLVHEQDEPLFFKLRQKRKELAVAMNVPSYIVFSDKSLIEMVKNKPRNYDEMRLISGVGQKKLSKFGDLFLSIINGKKTEKMHRLRKKIAGKPSALLYDKLEEVVNKLKRGESGLDKPIHVSRALILRISELEPKKLSDLKSIDGVTKGLFQRYGRPFIKVITSKN